MKLVVGIKNNISQIFAVAEKNVKLLLRYKITLILTFITPVLGFIVPLIIMGKIFTLADNFGPWNNNNFIVYQFTTYHISLLYSIIFRFQGSIAREKGQNTLTLLVIAPFRRINLLFGIFLSHLIIIGIPFMVFFILCYILYPVSIITVFIIFFTYFIITLIFSGIGLVLAIFVISKQHLVSLFYLPLTVLVMFSALTMPFEFFPEYFQNIARLNPFYYIFSVVRFVWIEDNIIISITAHPINYLIVLSLAIASPLIGLKFFNYIFDKYGISIY